MREVAMNVFGDKRFWYLVAAVIVVVLAVAMWPRKVVEAPPSPTATSAPATAPSVPTTAPAAPASTNAPTAAPEAPAKQ
jgi:hypothetical protein